MFNRACKDAHNELKRCVTSAPIMQPLNWDEPFEIICDASDYTVGAVFGQRIGNNLHVIAYTCSMLDEKQSNYHITKKFRSYLLSTKVVVFIDHTTLRYLLKKN